MVTNKTSIILSDVSIEGDVVEKDNIILDASAAGTDVGEDLLLDSSGQRDAGGKVLTFRSIYYLVAGNEGGFILLNGTDGSSTNAGDELL